MDHPTCPVCRGARHIEVARGKLVQGPGRSFRHPLISTIQLDRCPTCAGAGRVATADLIAAEQRRIDAEKTAWDATLPDHLANALEREAAGLEPY